MSTNKTLRPANVIGHRIYELEEDIYQLEMWLIQNPTAALDSQQEVVQRLREYNDELNTLKNQVNGTNN